MVESKTATCPSCGKTYVPALGERRRPDLLIQQEFPGATPIQHEQLQTGICSDECWDAMLGDEPDDR